MAPNPESKIWCAKNVFVTINGYDLEAINFEELKEKSSYFSYGEECAPTTGEPHIHMTIQFFERHRMSAVKRILGHNHANIQTQRDDRAILYYKYLDYDSATHIGTIPNPYYVEWGGYESLGSQQDPYTKALALARVGSFDAIDPKMYLRYRSALHAEYTPPEPDPLPHCCGYWIYGPPGCGKTETAQSFARPFAMFSSYSLWYEKWPGDCEKLQSVIIDDIQPGSAHHWYEILLLSAHTSPFRVKPMYKDPRVIRPRFVFVTSNYRIEELYDGLRLEAIKRRFNFIDFCSSPHFDQTLRRDVRPPDILTLL